MRLFLSSKDFGRHVDRLHDMTGENNRALVVFNARDHYAESYMTLKVKQKRRMFEKNGFVFKNLDLRKYFGKTQELREFIGEFNPGLVYVMGGNTFLLRRAMLQSGFDEILRQGLADNKYVYAGGSSGAMVLSKDLRFYLHKDNSENVTPDGYGTQVINDGLGLVDFYVVPHRNTVWFRNAVATIMKNLSGKNEEVIQLGDSDIVMIDGDRKEILR